MSFAQLCHRHSGGSKRQFVICSVDSNCLCGRNEKPRTPSCAHFLERLAARLRSAERDDFRLPLPASLRTLEMFSGSSNRSRRICSSGMARSRKNRTRERRAPGLSDLDNLKTQCNASDNETCVFLDWLLFFESDPKSLQLISMCQQFALRVFVTMALFPRNSGRRATTSAAQTLRIHSRASA